MAHQDKMLPTFHRTFTAARDWSDAPTPLYTHPPVIDKSAAIRIATALGWEPKKEWVGLTDEEVKAIFDSVPTASCQSYDHWRSLVAHAIEQSLRSKNEQT